MKVGQRGGSTTKFVLRLLVLTAGLGLFGWFIYQAGPAAILETFSGLGWKAPVVLLPYVLVYFVDCTAWWISFGRAGVPGVGFLTLFRVRWSGEAVNCVIPSGYIGGEAVKVYLLHKRGVPPMQAGCASVVSKSCQTLAMVLFIGVGALLGIPYLAPDSPARQGMVVVTCLAFLAMGLLFWLQLRGMFGTLLAVLERLRIRIRSLVKQKEHLLHLDQRVQSFYSQERRHFFYTTLVFFGGWMADTLEILLVCHLFGLDLDWRLAFALEAFISVAKAIGIFSPGSIGVQESGVVFLFHLFGLPAPVGISYAIVRRVRELVFGMVGWGMLAAEESSLKGLTRRIEEEAKALE